jgi:hypothetical protein
MLRTSLITVWLAFGLLAACNESHEPRVEDSQTHWLRSCYHSSSCGGLACLCGVCAAPCDEQACDVAGRRTSCVQPEADALRAMCGTATSVVALCLEPCAGGCPAGQQCVAGSCVAARAQPLQRAGCTRDGTFYEIGERGVPAPDGCNHCECTANGIDQCTLAFCEFHPPRPTRCTAHGVHYDIGQEMPAPDGCNTCLCTVDGPDLCTQRDCKLRSSSAGCKVDGLHYDVGVAVPGPEGCGGCSCNVDGTFTCDPIACGDALGAGVEDAGTEDAGTEDAGTEDAGTEDAGTEDTGAQPQDPGCSTNVTPQKDYADQRELEALLVGRWAPCMPSDQPGYGFKGEEAGVEFVPGGTWYGLSEVNGQIVRNEASGTWSFTPPDQFMIDALRTDAPFITGSPRSARIGVDPRFPRYVPLTR